MGIKICECCRKPFTSKHPSQRFCTHKGKGDCKDRFHNTNDPARAELFQADPAKRPAPDSNEDQDGDLFGLGNYDPGDDEYWGGKDY